MRFLIPVLVFSFAAGHAVAQAPAPPADTPAAITAPAPRVASGRTAFMRRFQAANTTHDGHLTKDQAKAAHMAGTVRHFASIDKDHKGYVTLDDFRAHAASQRAQRAASKQKPPA